MIKDITLGQYLPGETPVHRLDPRVKILIVFAFVIILFMVKKPVGYLAFALFVIGACIVAKIPMKMMAKSLKPLLFFILFTAIINLFMTKGEVVFSFYIFKITKEGIKMAAAMALRLIFLVSGTSLLTYTTSPIVLTDGIESLLMPFSKIGFPAHEIAMMMTIALRFIPTIIDETDKIIKAQSARGSDFESGNLLRRAKALVPILVPLFVSAFRRADDLATAMESRCYRGGNGRTKLTALKITGTDIVALCICTAFFAATLIFGR